MKRGVVKIALGLMLSIGFIGCTASGEVYEDPGMTMEQRERATPAEFIVVNAEYDDELLGTSNITGTLQNTASRTNYKDVMITVNYYDEAGNLLGSNNYTVADDLAIGETEGFKVEVQPPDNTENVTWSVTGASPME